MCKTKLLLFSINFVLALSPQAYFVWFFLLREKEQQTIDEFNFYFSLFFNYFNIFIMLSSTLSISASKLALRS